jgi:hypothetical protein
MYEPLPPIRRAGASSAMAEGVTHLAGEVISGRQKCARCDAELPVSPNGNGFQAGVLVQHELLPNGDRMSAVRGIDLSRFPPCPASRG